MDPPRRSGWLPVWYRFRRDRLALFGGAFIVLLVLVAILAPVLPIRNPNHGYYELLPPNGQPVAPGAMFVLGSEPNGRDLFSRIFWVSSLSRSIGCRDNRMALGVVVPAW